MCISSTSAPNKKLSAPMDSKNPNPLGMSTHTPYVRQKYTSKAPSIVRIIIKLLNVNNHKNNTSHHDKSLFEAWICQIDTDRPQIIIIHHHRPKLISDLAVDFVKLGWPGQEWSKWWPKSKFLMLQVHNRYNMLNYLC